MSDHIKILRDMRERFGESPLFSEEREALDAAISSLRQVPEVAQIASEMYDSEDMRVTGWRERLLSINATKCVPECLLKPDKVPTDAECSSNAARYFYAKGWNECRYKIYNPAPPTSGKPSECADGCPPFQVCDHCQQPSDAVWLMPVATQEPGDSRLLRFAWGRSNLSTGQIAHAYDCIVAAAKECGQTLATHATPAQAGAELPNIIDEALELMEMHGMHGEREYQQLAAAHRALTRRGGS